VTTLLPSVKTVAAPRVRSVPEYSFTSGVEAVELAESVGLKPDPWQRDAVYDILAEDKSGYWASFESALIVPRQNGKGSVLEVIDLADLFLFSSSQRDFLSIHTAHEFKTAQEAFRRVLFWVENSDMLRKKVARIRTSHGEEGIELLNGARLRFLARSNGSGRGFSADRLMYDEAYDLPEETVAASLPIMSARPNPSLIYASSAPLDGAKSSVLRRVMRRGRLEPETRDGEIPEPDPNLCYIEFSADPKADIDDEAEWVRANPGVTSGRIRVEFIAKERSALSEVSFGRERLGILDESSGASVIDMAVWADLADPLAGPPLDPVCFAVDVSPDRMGSVAVAGRLADGSVYSEVIRNEKGDGWIVDYVAGLVTKWQTRSVVLDAIGPAGALLAGFAEAGIDVDVINMREYGHACQGFYNMVADGKFTHKGQPGLTAALESARKRPLGDSGAWGWHRRDATNISPLVAVTLATFADARANGSAVQPTDNRMFVFG
jgi:phage terminase large subunit-like protein